MLTDTDDGAPETALTPRELERARNLAFEIYRHAFHTIDCEPEFDGADAGYIATAVEQAFLKAYARRLNGPFELA